MIIEQIPIDNNAFVFGLNTLIALVFQTLISILITKNQYLNDIKRQVKSPTFKKLIISVYSIRRFPCSNWFYIFGNFHLQATPSNKLNN